MATALLLSFAAGAAASLPSTPFRRTRRRHIALTASSSFSPSPSFLSLTSPLRSHRLLLPSPRPLAQRGSGRGFTLVACLPPSSPKRDAPPSTKLYVSGLSFRTTEESLRNAFEKFGQLVEVNLVMDRIANRPRGFAFLRYATEEESKIAIEGMHGKFLDGRVIFVEYARPRSELGQVNPKQRY